MIDPVLTSDTRPGFATSRLVRLVADAVTECRLDLTGRVVLTEAATGPYVVTPVLAALAGAEVVAVTRASRFGSVAEVEAATRELATAAEVSHRIEIVTDKTPEVLARADVMTNSGHLRPIDAHTIARLSPTAVVPLMFEAWEIQAGRFDVDLDSLHRRGIRTAGTNERNPAVDVFSYLGPMAVSSLMGAGVAVYRSRIAVLCDNPFTDYLASGLQRVGAKVVLSDDIDELLEQSPPDALLVAMRPRGVPVLNARDAVRISQAWPGTFVAQYWGDIDRAAFADCGVPCWPAQEPGTGHMAVLPSVLGPEPVVRLQAGGLKVGEVLLKDPERRTDFDEAFLDEL